MARFLVIASLATLTEACTTKLSNTIPVDDSYTVSQRYDSYHEGHPNFAIPVLQPDAGQKILFDRRYKKIGTRELHLDIFLPAAPGPTGQAIVLVHGGAWRSGNKSNFYAMANLLAQRGYAVFLPEFRLSPEAGYPAGLLDINDAVNWVKANAKAFGIDPEHIAIGGESTGGQMAALLAYTGGTNRFSVDNVAPRFNALIDIDGVLDLTAPLALRFENAAGRKSPAALWLGGSMEQIPDRWKEASATTYLSDTSPPTLIISGEEDRFTAGRDDVLAALSKSGVPAEHVHFRAMPHTFWLFDPCLDQVVTAIDTFMQKNVDNREQK